MFVNLCRKFWSALNSHWLPSFHYTCKHKNWLVPKQTLISTMVYIQEKTSLGRILSFRPTLCSWVSVWGVSRSQERSILGFLALFPCSEANHQPQHLLTESDTRAGVMTGTLRSPFHFDTWCFRLREITWRKSFLFLSSRPINLSLKVIFNDELIEWNHTVPNINV